MADELRRGRQRPAAGGASSSGEPLVRSSATPIAGVGAVGLGAKEEKLADSARSWKGSSNQKKEDIRPLRGVQRPPAAPPPKEDKWFDASVRQEFPVEPKEEKAGCGRNLVRGDDASPLGTSSAAPTYIAASPQHLKEEKSADTVQRIPSTALKEERWSNQSSGAPSHVEAVGGSCVGTMAANLAGARREEKLRC